MRTIASHAHFCAKFEKMTSTSPTATVDFLVAPAAKRAKLSAGDGNAQQVAGASRHLVSKHLTSIQENHIKSEFPLRSLEDFYKDCPTYRLPVEIGSFSLDNKGKQLLDRSQLRYYVAPPPHSSSSNRLNFDLKLGYDKYVPTPRSVPSEKLNPILRWVASNGDCFRPKPFSPKSPNKAEGEVPQGSAVDGTGRRVSVGEIFTSPAPVSKER